MRIPDAPYYSEPVQMSTRNPTDCTNAMATTNLPNIHPHMLHELLHSPMLFLQLNPLIMSLLYDNEDWSLETEDNSWLQQVRRVLQCRLVPGAVTNNAETDVVEFG